MTIDPPIASLSQAAVKAAILCPEILLPANRFERALTEIEFPRFLFASKNAALNPAEQHFTFSAELTPRRRKRLLRQLLSEARHPSCGKLHRHM